MLLNVRQTLTRSDHQTHKRYRFEVPADCTRLHVRVAYSPKHLDEQTSTDLAWSALRTQSTQLANRVGDDLAARWTADLTRRAERVRIPNLVTVSLDDATGAYRGAAHRQAPDQTLTISPETASPGLVPGALPAGEWTLVLSVHTLVSPQCDVSIEISVATTS